MIVHDWLPCYGDLDYRNKKCPKEAQEQISFFQALPAFYPEFATIALHPKNEAKRTWGQARYDKLNGLNPGASDIIIPAGPLPFVCELKRRDRTLCVWQPNQLDYLRAAKQLGAFVCVALGWEAAIEAVGEWQEQRSKLL